MTMEQAVGPRGDREVMFLAYALPLTLLFFYALVCILISELCKIHFCYKFHKKIIDIRLLP